MPEFAKDRPRDAKLPRLKTLEEFDFNQGRRIPAAKIRELSEGGYGPGKTHWATGLCVAACRQKRRARSPNQGMGPEAVTLPAGACAGT